MKKEKKLIALEGLPAGKEDHYYEMLGACRNCKKSGTLYFTKGMSTYMHRCANCGVKFMGNDFRLV